VSEQLMKFGFMKYLSAVFFLLSNLYVHAQNNATAILTRADSLFEYGEYSNSILNYDKAAILYNKSSDTKKYLYCSIQSAECDIRLGDLEEAESTIKDALSVCSSTNISQKALLENAYAKVYMQKGQLDQAHAEIIKAIDELTRLLPPDVSSIAECYNTLGLINWLSGNDEKALEYLSQALELRKKLYGENNPSVAAVYNNIGLVYSNTDLEAALQQYEKALAIYQKTYKEIHPNIAVAYSNLGQIYRKQEVYNTSLTNYEKSLSIWSKLYTEDHPNKAFIFSSIAQVYSDKNEYENALNYSFRALEMYKKCYGEKHPNTAACYTLLGSIYSLQSDYTNALKNFQLSLISNCSDFNNTDYRINPSVKKYFDGQLLLSTFSHKSMVLEKREAEKTLRLKDLTLALSTYQSCDTLVDQLRHTRTGKNDKLALGTYAYEVYDHSIHLCILLSQNTFRKNRYIKLAYYFMEKSKASVLQESIAEAKAKYFAGIPNSELDKEEELKANISYLEQKLAKGISDENEMKSVNTSLFETKRSYEAFIRSLEKNYPEYYNLKYNVQPVNLNDFQQKLKTNDCLLEYFVSENTNSIYIFKITSTAYNLYSVPLNTNYDKYISGLRNAIRFNIKPTFIKTSEALYKQLIPSIPKKTSHLIIIADGKMGSIPFETLLSKRPATDSSDYSEMDYLIKKYSISYNYAGSLYNPKSDTKTNEKVLLFAPVDFSTYSELNSLPGTLTEVTDLDTLFSKTSNTRLYTYNNAQRAILTSDSIANYSIIHLATHGSVDQEKPELSCIYTAGTVEEDDRIYLGDMYNMHLNAGLVTLSACQTGLGKLSKGEGTIGLSRALFYSGADNIMVSLWKVSDISTQLFMTDFYHNYLNPPHKNNYYSASRDAKLQLIHSGKFSNPYYWAPFILIGE